MNYGYLHVRLRRTKSCCADHTSPQRSRTLALLTWTVSKAGAFMATVIPLTDVRAASRRDAREAFVRDAASMPPARRDLAARHARPAAARPAHLGHRPLQLPLRLLHAEGRVRPRLPVPAARGAADVRGDRARRRACSSASACAKIRLTGGEPLLRRNLERLVEMLARARRRRPHADDQRRAARAKGARAARRRARRASR